MTGSTAFLLSRFLTHVCRLASLHSVFEATTQNQQQQEVATIVALPIFLLPMEPVTVLEPKNGYVLWFCTHPPLLKKRQVFLPIASPFLVLIFYGVTFIIRLAASPAAGCARTDRHDGTPKN
jgi:hypothetical protein